MGLTAIFAIAVAGPGMAGLPFGNRRKAMACMALPATQLEKFLSRYLLSTAGLVVVAVCAITVADLVQMAVALLVTGGVKGSFWSPSAVRSHRPTMRPTRCACCCSCWLPMCSSC